LQHFASQAPQIGTPAPDSTLVTLDGDLVRLSDYFSEKPLVLQFGSHSCPVYRYRRFSMNSLYKKYQGRVTFLMIYTQEAHPVGANSPYKDEEWVSWWNRLPGVLIPQHRDLSDRLDRASWSKAALNRNYQYEFLADTIDNSTWRLYGAASSPGFIIDSDGIVRLSQVWVNPKEIGEVIEQLLAPDQLD
jgi:peroxiredoxin